MKQTSLLACMTLTLVLFSLICSNELQSLGDNKDKKDSGKKHNKESSDVDCKAVALAAIHCDSDSCIGPKARQFIKECPEQLRRAQKKAQKKAKEGKEEGEAKRKEVKKESNKGHSFLMLRVKINEAKKADQKNASGALKTMAKGLDGCAAAKKARGRLRALSKAAKANAKLAKDILKKVAKKVDDKKKDNKEKTEIKKEKKAEAKEAHKKAEKKTWKAEDKVAVAKNLAMEAKDDPTVENIAKAKKAAVEAREHIKVAATANKDAKTAKKEARQAEKKGDKKTEKKSKRKKRMKPKKQRKKLKQNAKKWTKRQKKQE